MIDVQKVTSVLPLHMQRRVLPILDAVNLVSEVRNPRALGSMLPSIFRGLILRQGRNHASADIISGHRAHFEWDYPRDQAEMRALYRRAKENQWNADTTLDWSIDVDPENPNKRLVPVGFIDHDKIKTKVKLNAKERLRFDHSITAWMLSQFLHGEQGALFAAAQVTESVQWMDGKLYGATQVMDEGRHVETFHRYIDEKLGKLYVINDNLFTIIDALVSDSRWDMKFLGMQIMVEGLALGAFGTLYSITEEPLLKSLLRYIIQDEARHVHYGVLALRNHFQNELSEKELREREDWAFEVALLMRNRFQAHEVYEEWYEGIITRKEWDGFVDTAPGMREFRRVMFNRLMPNLKHIGLLSPRIQAHYHKAGLLHYAQGRNACELSGQEMLAELDQGPEHILAMKNGMQISA